MVGKPHPDDHAEAKRLRDKDGWTVAEIAKHLHLSQSTIYRWFRSPADLEAMERHRQACRHVAAQLRLTIDGALGRIRAYAADHDQPVDQVVDEILAGTLDLASS